jgi:hypothetical protein
VRSELLRCALDRARAERLQHGPFRARIVPPQLCEHPPRSASIDVEHYALELALEPATRSIRGACTLRFFPRTQALQRIELAFRA